MNTYEDYFEGRLIQSQLDWTNLRASAYLPTTVLTPSNELEVHLELDKDFARKNAHDIELLYQACQDLRKQAVEKVAEKLKTRPNG